MRAIEITQPGPPDVLKLCERPMPVPEAGHVLIKVHAAGINRPDVLQRTGNYPVPPGASDIPGLEVSGVIEALGPDAPPMSLDGIKPQNGTHTRRKHEEWRNNHDALDPNYLDRTSTCPRQCCSLAGL